MNQHTTASHTIHIDAPVGPCQRFFTPAGEELWVDGWQPRYLWPSDGRTEKGMVFTTGEGEDFTIWSLLDFETQPHYARYSRVTPASRSGWVEVHCVAEGPQATAVTVRYTMTALHEAAASTLSAYEGASFVKMIDEWRELIHAKLPLLLAASIR